MAGLLSFRCYLIETDQWLEIHRGESSHNRRGGPLGGKFFSTDYEWARQFTQSGLDSEILTRKIRIADILDKRDTYAGDDFEDLLRQAKSKGYKAVRFNEGSGEPDSVYVIDLKALRV